MQLKSAQVPRSHWLDWNNQRKFLNNLAASFDIRVPSDWGKLSIRDVERNGGRTIISHYNNSLLHTLKSVYPGDSNYQIIRRNNLGNKLVEKFKQIQQKFSQRQTSQNSTSSITKKIGNSRSYTLGISNKRKSDRKWRRKFIEVLQQQHI